MTGDKIALVLLAAGRGTRFGGAKLAATLADKPVARHAADMLLTHPFCAHFAVVSAKTPALPGYVPILLDPPGAPQAQSVAQGVAAARTAGATAVMIALADMPLVPHNHIAAMIAAFDGDRLGSLGPAAPLPPVLFGSQHFDALCELTGDRGAGALLRGAPTLPLSDAAALDIDHPGDLARAAALMQP